MGGLHDQPVAERGEGFLVEALAPLEVRHGDPHVIQHHSPPMVYRTVPTPVGPSILMAPCSATASFGEGLTGEVPRTPSLSARARRRPGQMASVFGRVHASRDDGGRSILGSARSARRCGERGPQGFRTRRHRRREPAWPAPATGTSTPSGGALPTCGALSVLRAVNRLRVVHPSRPSCARDHSLGYPGSPPERSGARSMPRLGTGEESTIEVVGLPQRASL